MTPRTKDESPRFSVLVVDDEEAVRETIAGLLDEDADVVTCESPVRALELASRNAFDVVCSDFTMPEMNGIELLGRLAKRHPSMGLMLITGSSDYLHRSPDDRFYVLLKPFDPSRLVRLVKQIGQLSQMRRSVSEMSDANVRTRA